MSMNDIVFDDFGQVITATILDTDTDAAADISGYTTSQKFVLKDPSGNEAEKTAAFVSDGSDGQIDYTLVDGDIDESGNWEIRAEVKSATATLTTLWHRFQVKE